jgi:IBR domain, a half RING-finger domain
MAASWLRLRRSKKALGVSILRANMLQRLSSVVTATSRNQVGRADLQCQVRLPMMKLVAISRAPSVGSNLMRIGVLPADTFTVFRVWSASAHIRQIISDFHSNGLGIRASAIMSSGSKSWRALCPATSSEKLLESSFDKYIRQNPDKLKFCPTADCSQIYRVSTEAGEFSCTTRHRLTCTGCGASSHEGLTCSEHTKNGRRQELSISRNGWTRTLSSPVQGVTPRWRSQTDVIM